MHSIKSAWTSALTAGKPLTKTEASSQPLSFGLWIATRSSPRPALRQVVQKPIQRSKRGSSPAAISGVMKSSPHCRTRKVSAKPCSGGWVFESLSAPGLTSTGSAPLTGF